MIASGNDAIASLAGRFVRQHGLNELSGIQSTASTQSEWMLSDAMIKDMEKQGTDFRQLRQRPTTIYVVMDPCRYRLGPRRAFYAGSGEHPVCAR